MDIKSGWREETKNFINKIKDEFNEDIKNNKENIELETKINSLFKLAEDKYQQNCRDQIKDILNYVKKNRSGDNQYEPLPTKEKDFLSAAIKLEDCRKPYIKSLQNFNYISHYTRQMFQMQADYCYDECDKVEKDPGKLESCLKDFCVKSIKLSFKTMTGLLSKTADSFIEELNKH